MDRTAQQSPYNSEKPLKRGRACLTCRFLKIKCDGKKPVCGPCLRHPKEDPCEYSEGPGRSRYRHLEETIHRLEARLRELENPDDATPSVTLHDPYSQPAQNLLVPEPAASASAGSPLLSSVYSPTSPIHMTSPTSIKSSPSGSGSLPLSSMSPPSHEQDLPPALVQSLCDSFLPYATEFGFFLDRDRFYASAIQNTSADETTRPCPAVVSAVSLWGAHLSTAGSQLRAREPKLLLRAQIDTATSLTRCEHHPQRVLHTIQAEVLLAYYHWRAGQILEAKMHSANASSLLISAGFHQVRSGQQHVSQKIIRVSSDSPLYVPEPADVVEEGERINGCWSVYVLSNLLGLGTEQPTNIGGPFDVPNVQIDTPWPFESEDYRKGRLPPRSVATISQYLSYPPKTELEQLDESGLELVAKASILLYHATRLNAQPITSRTPAFWTNFQILNNHIIEYRRTLPSLADCTTNEPLAHAIYLGLCLANTAAIRIHVLCYSDSTSFRACLDAAESIFRPAKNVDVRQFHCVHPIFGTLWTSACQILVGHLQPPDGAWPPPDIDSRSGDGRLYDTLQYGLSVFQHFSATSHMTSKCSARFGPTPIDDVRLSVPKGPGVANEPCYDYQHSSPPPSYEADEVPSEWVEYLIEMGEKPMMSPTSTSSTISCRCADCNAAPHAPPPPPPPAAIYAF